jgi:hypothetical protein
MRQLESGLEDARDKQIFREFILEEKTEEEISGSIGISGN